MVAQGKHRFIIVGIHSTEYYGSITSNFTLTDKNTAGVMMEKRQNKLLVMGGGGGSRSSFADSWVWKTRYESQSTTVICASHSMGFWGGGVVAIKLKKTEDIGSSGTVSSFVRTTLLIV
jgi:hypothetical protein